jgi:hypothetical protein
MRLFVPTEKTILPQRVIEKIKTLLKGIYFAFGDILYKYPQKIFLYVFDVLQIYFYAGTESLLIV